MDKGLGGLITGGVFSLYICVSMFESVDINEQFR